MASPFTAFEIAFFYLEDKNPLSGKPHIHYMNPKRMHKILTGCLDNISRNGVHMVPQIQEALSDLERKI